MCVSVSMWNVSLWTPDPRKREYVREICCWMYWLKVSVSMKPMLYVSETVPCMARWNSRFSVEMLPV